MNMKKQLAAALLCLVAFALTAQPQDYQSSIRYWDEGKLTLEDFVVRNMWSIDDKATSLLAHGWLQEDKTLRFGNLRYDRPVTRTYMDKVNSWIKSGFDVHEAIEFNQVIFDLVEVTRRKLQNELDTNRTNRVDAIANFYSTVCDNAINEFIASSQYGTDTAVVRKYRTRLEQTLTETTQNEWFEPVIPLGKWGFGWHLGAAGEYFLGEGSDFFSPRYGLDFGFESVYSRLRIDVNMILAFGSLRRNVPFWHRDNSELVHDWGAGERISGGAVELSAGFDVLNNTRFTLTPFAGIGAGFIDRTNKYLQKDGDDKFINEELGGFRTLAGVQGDWKLRRRYSLLWYGRTYAETSLRFRLYVAKTNFRSPCQTYSLNFGIALNGFGRTVK